jgi:ParB family chromosome partitioning protein
MGRGLDAILSIAAAEGHDEELRNIPVELISPNSTQPRRRFEDGPLQALAGSLKERGVLQPVLVRPQLDGRYELIAGERRWRAAMIAEIAQIPAIVRRHDDAASLEIALVENMVREDLNPIEEARACAALVEELGLTREQVGSRVGRGRVAVSNLIRLLDLPDEALELIEAGALSEGHGRALLLAEDHAVRRRLARAAATEEWSVRTLEAEARRGSGKEPPSGRERKRKQAPHPDQDAASAEIAQLLEAVTGAEVAVRADAKGRYKAELTFASVEEARELAARLEGVLS